MVKIRLMQRNGFYHLICLTAFLASGTSVECMRMNAVLRHTIFCFAVMHSTHTRRYPGIQYR